MLATSGDTAQARFQRDGYLAPVPILSPAEARAHRRRLEAAEAAHGALHYRVKPYLVFGSAREIATNPRLLDAVEAVLGPDILLWDSAYVIKEPGHATFVSWHQDLTYWGLDSDRMVTAWVALSEVTAKAGAMQVVPGSHVAGKVAHADTHRPDNALHRGQDASAEVDAGRAVPLALRPGQASLHHGWLLHASGPNRSADRRIGLTLQYVTPSVRQTLTDRESATLVRGRDGFGHFRPEPHWPRDFDPAAIAFQEEAEALKRWVYDRA